MGKTFFSHEGFYSLISVSGEGDLKGRPGQISLNPPPRDGKCECCGRHICELEPFGKAGDPLVGDFEGDYLIKIFRPDGILSDEQFEVVYESTDPEDPDAWDHAVNDRYVGSQASWECRDCIILSPEEYFEKLR